MPLCLFIIRPLTYQCRIVNQLCRGWSPEKKTTSASGALAAFLDKGPSETYRMLNQQTC